MRRIKTHKIALELNNKQMTYCKKAAGIGRLAYNWVVHERSEWHKYGLNLSGRDAIKLFNSIKETDFPFITEISQYISKYAMKNANIAFDRFFTHKSKYPKFKKKGDRDSFRIDNGTDKNNPNAVEIYKNRIYITSLGWVRMREELRFDGQITQAVVSRTADRWFVAISVEVEDEVIQRENQTKKTGIDLGVKHLVVDSEGRKIDGRKPLRANQKRIRRESKSLARKKEGSKNYKKEQKRLAKLHAYIANCRKDEIHKITTKYVKTSALICIEDLSIKWMLKNHKLARAVSDMGFGEFAHQMKYKSDWYRCILVIANRFYASSKLCSKCEHKMDKMPLSIREWTCPKCGCIHDRDINAAINLLLYALKWLEHNYSTAESLPVAACGEKSSGEVQSLSNLDSVKQELNSKYTAKGSEFV